MLYREKSYESDNKLLAGVAGLRSPVHITLDASKLTADANGQKCLGGGFWVAQSTDGMGRALPRSKATAAATTADTTLTLEDVQAFIPGDTVYAVPASAQIDLGAAWAAGNTLTITVAGVDYVYTAAAAATAAEFAAAVAADFNINPQTRGIAQAISGAAALTITAADFTTPHTIAVAATGGTATLAGGATMLLPYRMIGTVDAGGVDVTAKTLTLTAPAAVAIAEGMPMGTADIPIGLHLRAHDFNEEAEEAGLYTSLSGKRGAFPYLDAGLEKQFVEIQATNA